MSHKKPYRTSCGVKERALPRKGKMPVHETLRSRFESATLPVLEAKLAKIKAESGNLKSGNI